MKERFFLVSICTAALLSTNVAFAGPCNTGNKDAGSGPTPGHTAQTTTTGAAPRSGEHPPTSTMDKASSDVATSSQDAQRQMHGQPTASEQAQGAARKAENDGC
jgi:hypothetical protein